ncbi:putative Ig domain-containing protein, partial [Novipirellula maiorica]
MLFNRRVGQSPGSRAGKRQKRRKILEHLEPRLLLANSPPVISSSISDLTTEAGIPFEYDLQPTGYVVFGYGVGGVGLSATDNYFASNVNFLGSWQDVTFTGNTVFTESPWYAAQISESGTALDEYTWDNNAYVTDAESPFIIEGVFETFDQWRTQTGFDASSTLTTSISGTHVTVRPNEYEPGRGHAVVYNWDRLDNVDLDLSSVVDPGANFEIYNVLDLDGAPVLSGVYDGSAVSLPMTDVASPIPIGAAPVAPLVVDKEFGSFLVVSDAPSVPATGNEFFVSPAGTPQGDGSLNDPWDLWTAMSHPEAVSAGDTIWIQGGSYVGAFTSHLSGTPWNPIWVREWPGDEVIIDLNNGSPRTSEILTIEGQHTYYQGLEIFSSDLSGRITFEGGSWPDDINRGNINVFGDHVKLINWEIHDINKGIGFWSPADGGEVYGSLIYNNGWSGPSFEHGHGIYSQNEDFNRRFADNILFNQYRHGVKIFGSSSASLKNYVLEGNISFNNGAASREGFEGSWQYYIGGGSLAENITLNQNYAYASRRAIRDPDAYDVVTFSAQQSNGDPLPAWLDLSRNDENEVYLKGTPSPADVGTIEIELTATDIAGESITEVFQLTVEPVNQAPTVIADVEDLSLRRNEGISFDVSVAFDDPEDRPMTYSLAPQAGGVIPSWIGIDANSGVISGAAVELGTIALEVFAIDDAGNFVSDVFTLTVNNATVVELFPLNPFEQKLDGQWQGSTVASDGKVYFASSTHAHDAAGLFFQYDPSTGEVTQIGPNVSAILGEDPHNQVPQGKLHSPIVEANGWLYTSTFVGNYWDEALNAFTGAHLFGYELGSTELGTPNFIDFGIPIPRYSTYSAVAISPDGHYLWSIASPWAAADAAVSGAHLFRTEIASGIMQDFGVLTPDINAIQGGFAMHVDARGDAWITMIGGVDRLFVGRAASSTIDVYPGALPSMTSADDPDALSAYQDASWWRWGQSIDDERFLFTIHDRSAPFAARSGGSLWEFDASKTTDGDLGDAFREVAWIGGNNLGMTYDDGIVYFVRRNDGSHDPKINAVQGNGEYWSNASDTGERLHLYSVHVDDPDSVITDWGQITDADGRIPWRIESISANTATGEVYLTGDWVMLETDPNSWRTLRHDGDTSTTYTLHIRGQAFAVAQTIASSNEPPQLNAEIADATIDEDTPYILDVANHFSDPDGDALTYSISRDGGGVLPSWISIHSSSGVISGTPSNDDVGTLTIRVTGTDPGFASVTDTFELTVNNTNDVPFVTIPILDRAIPANDSLDYDVSDSFDDVDDGDSLTYSAALPDEPTLEFEPIVSGLDTPVVVTHAGDESGRLFVVEKRGVIHIVENGSVLPTPFLDIRSQVISSSDRGLLGLAFHPDYATAGAPGEGQFFVYYVAAATFGGDYDGVLSEFAVSADDPDIADAGSETVRLRFDLPAGHIGGDLAFGPDDHMLYLSTGDAAYGGSGDPNNHAQDRNLLFGKVLRIDVDGTNGPDGTYGIPADNPFVGESNVREEIYALGFRNPYRFSIDDGPDGTASPDRIFVGDVGEKAFEEVNLVVSGGNYGWRIREGTLTFTTSDADPGNLIDPIAQYVNPDVGVSVIGGHVYRGSDTPSLTGRYVFADLTGRIMILDEAAGDWLLSDPIIVGGNPFSEMIVSIGADQSGELYVATLSSIYKITANPVLDDRSLPAWLSFDPATATFTGTPDNGDIGTTTIEVTGTDLAGESVSDTFDLTVNFVPPQADLVVTISDSSDPVIVGENLVYTVSVSNEGPKIAQDVVLTNHLPSEVQFVSATTPCDESAGIVSCALGDLMVGDAETFYIEVIPTVAGQLTNTASAASSTADPNTDNNAISETTVVDPLRADLFVTIRDDADPVQEGDHVVYTLTVTNEGPNHAVGTVLTTTLPASVTFVSSSSDCSDDGGEITCNIGDLASGQTVDLQIEMATTTPGEISNIATVTSDTLDPNSTNNVNTETTQVDAILADLEVTLVNEESRVDLGDNITYHATVTNNGPSPAENVVFTNTLPTDVAFVSSTPLCTYATGTITCELGDLESGETVDLEFIVSATESGQQISTATVTADTSDPDASNNSISEATMVAGPPGSADIVFVSFESSGRVDNIPYDDEDILAFDTTTGKWSLYFDGSHIGFANVDVDAFHVEPDGNILLSFDGNKSISGFGLVRDSDILRFRPTAHGALTAGSFEWFFDGSDVGLAPTSGDVDSIGFTPDGRLLVSLIGNYLLSDISVSGDDLLVFDGAQFGENTSGNWSLYTDGADVGLDGNNVKGVSMDATSGEVHVTTANEFSNGTITSGSRDILTLLPRIDAPGSYTLSEWFDGVTNRVAEDQSFDGIQVGSWTGSEVFGQEVIYMSPASNLYAGGFYVADEDIVYHDTRTGSWQLLFDGSDVGITTDVNAFHLLDDGSMLMSFNTTTAIPGVGSVLAPDIVRFIPSSIGDHTEGEFELYFDGSDVGLTTYYEDIDAISLDPSGNLIISVSGPYSVDGVSGSDADLLKFNATSLGSETEGSWQMHFDGSDLAMTSSTEDITGVSTHPITGQIYFTTLGNVATGTFSGAGTDVLNCIGGSIGDATTCEVSNLYSAAPNGFSQSLDALHVAIPSDLSGVDLAVSVSGPAEPVVVGDQVRFTLTLTNHGPATAENVVLSNALPLDASFVSASLGYTLDSGALTFELGDVDAGESLPLEVIVATSQPTTLVNTASVDSDSEDRVAANDTRTATAVVNPVLADLVVTQSDGADPVTAGDSITYQVAIRNIGPQPAADVVVTNTLPENVELVSTSLPYSLSGRILTYQLGDIDSGTLRNIDIEVRTTTTGTLTNSVQVSSSTVDPDTENNDSQETTEVNPPQADLRVTLDHSADPVIVGDSYRYDLTVTNLGPEPATNVVLSNALPAGTQFVSATFQR